jgi:S1-C subfamily serine protease
MKRPLRLLIAVAVAAAVGGLSAYGFLSIHGGAPGRASLPTIALLAAGGRTVSSPAPRVDAAVSYPAADRGHPVTIASYRDAVARAGPSVVTVHSAHTSKGRLPLGPTVLVKGLGSGVIVDRDGYIVTNHHVIDGATQVAVGLPDGTLHMTRVVGTDPESDIALIKIDVEGLRPIEQTDINDVAVGDVVLAVGNPLGVGQTVTQGIVSAIVRKGMNPVENFIQTDAAINPGNSGGALIDSAGRLVGINVAILSHSGGSEGIGFAIPVDYVQTVASALKTKGRVDRGWLGVSTAPPPHGDGASVVAVERNGPAERAGIAPGDVIVRIGEKPVSHAQDARSIVIGVGPGARVPIEIVRDGKREVFDVQLAPIPPQPAP